MELIEALVLAMLLGLGAVLIHYEALRLLARAGRRRGGYARTHVVVSILGILIAHLTEAALFAVGYWFAIEVLKINGFSSTTAMTRLQYMYFSTETFTTQGVGDVYAVGALRMVASVEPLIGLVLIGWSTAFTFQIAENLTSSATAR